MKRTLRALLLAACVTAAVTSSLAEDAIDAQRRSVGGGSRFDTSGANLVPPPQPKPQVQIITYTAVSELRQWTNLKGQKMVGRLLAFSAPKEGEEGPVVVIVDEKVRFLVMNAQGKQNVTDYPLADLSKEDRELAERIATAAKKGKPKPPVAPKTEEKPAEPAKPAGTE